MVGGEKAMATHSSTLAWKISRRSLVGCSPWDHEESDTTGRLHFHFSLSCIGEGNGNPLQYSCLENPRDRGAWWAVVYGVAQSRTRLKWLSSSSSSMGFEAKTINKLQREKTESKRKKNGNKKTKCSKNPCYYSICLASVISASYKLLLNAITL